MFMKSKRMKYFLRFYGAFKMSSKKGSFKRHMATWT